MNMPTRETATILAALRRWQIHLENRLPNTSEFEDMASISTNGAAFESLSASEIDQLCEHINLGGDEPMPKPFEIVVGIDFRTSESERCRSFQAVSDNVAWACADFTGEHLDRFLCVDSRTADGDLFLSRCREIVSEPAKLH